MHWEMERYFLRIKKIHFTLEYMTCNQKWFKSGLKEFLQIIIKLILLEENH